jgi:uncharacterized protein YaiI (UPF0178 family)
MADIRPSGVNTGGPTTFIPADSKTFASQMDRFLSQAI